MATAYKVFFNRQQYGANVLPGGTTTWFSTSELSGEKAHRKLGTEAIKVTAPLETCELIEVEAETEEAAVTAVRLKLGAFESEGELAICTAANFKKKSAR